MEALNFEAEPFELEAPSTGCGCAQCRQQEFDDSDSEWEWESNPRKKCSEGTPNEVEECDSEPEVKAIQCLPSANKRCPALPETWKSKTIAGVPFYYGPKISKVATNRYEVTNDG